MPNSLLHLSQYNFVIIPSVPRFIKSSVFPHLHVGVVTLVTYLISTPPDTMSNTSSLIILNFSVFSMIMFPLFNVSPSFNIIIYEAC